METNGETSPLLRLVSACDISTRDCHPSDSLESDPLANKFINLELGYRVNKFVFSMESYSDA